MAKNLILWLIIGGVMFSVYNNMAPTAPSNELGYSQFVTAVQSERVVDPKKPE